MVSPRKVRRNLKVKTEEKAKHWWLTPVILATPEAEIRRIKVGGQLGQILLQTLSQKYPTQKEGLTEWLKW
jgi:hypothetical protein